VSRKKRVEKKSEKMREMTERRRPSVFQSLSSAILKKRKEKKKKGGARRRETKRKRRNTQTVGHSIRKIYDEHRTGVVLTFCFF
jgi:hypothetical protein